MRRLLASLFGCSHEAYSWPQGPRNGPHTVTCISCSQEFWYDWPAMRRGRKVERPAGDEASGPGVTTTDTSIVPQPSSQYPPWMVS